MRQQMRTEGDMKIFLGWVTSCCVLHNMLARLGDNWEEKFPNMEPPERNDENVAPPVDAHSFREDLKRIVLEVNRNLGHIF